MRIRVCAAIAAVSLAFAGVVAATGTAGAVDTHTVTVAPSAELTDGQSVTVSGAGFVETPIINDWAVSECDAAILSEAVTLDNALHDCDVTTQPFVFAHADATGNLSTPFTVRKTFTTSGNVAVTCGQTTNDCAILVAQLTSSPGSFAFTGATAPISLVQPPRTVIACFQNLLRDQHPWAQRVRTFFECIVGVLAQQHRSTAS